MIRDVTTGFRIRISDPGVKKAPDPATLQKKNKTTRLRYFFSSPFCCCRIRYGKNQDLGYGMEKQD
jgi:hypothetical protein